MKSASNGGILKGGLQMLHVHVLLATPLRTGHMTQPGTDQHEGRVSVREAAHHPSAPADLPVESLNDIIGTDASPVFAGKIAISKSLLNPILHLLGGLFQLHGAQFFYHGPGFLTSSFLALLGMDCFEHLGHQLCLGTRCNGENIR